MSEAEWIAFLQRPEIPAFNLAMLENPDDDLPRLVFADWMDENCLDGAVNAAVRRSITHPEQLAAWPKHPEGTNWKLAFARGRVSARVNERTGPTTGPGGTLFDAVWRAGWVEFAGFGRGVGPAGLRRWLHDPDAAGLLFVAVSDETISANSLRKALACEHLTRVRKLNVCFLVGGGKLTNAVLDSDLSSLRELGFLSCRLDPDGVAALSSAPSSASLRVLNLQLSRADVEWAAALASSPFLSGLEKLILDRVTPALGTDGAAAIANSPYLCEGIRAQFRRPTDDGGANR